MVILQGGICVCPGRVEGTLRHFKEGQQYNKNDIVILQHWLTEARPSPKNEVWEQEVEGQRYICERPYTFSKKLEQELYSICFKHESQLIYGKKLPFFYDEEGR